MDENDEVFNLVKKDFETEEQFNFRKGIYEKVYSDTHSKQKAHIYSNIWVNILSLNCKYSKTIMNKIEKYKPTKNIYYETNND